MATPLIQIQALTKQFTYSYNNQTHSHLALDQLNLSIDKGVIHAVIGMSGAGKSTLLRCLNGLEEPTTGQILFDGETFPYQNAKALSLFRSKMGMVFQHFQLFSSRTVAQNITFPLEISGKSKKEQKERTEELLEIVGLKHKSDQYPCQLSGGEKQRVAIARALVTRPALLLCDEPTSALDPKTTRDILRLLEKLNQELGLTIVIITHQLESVKQICSKVSILSKGQIVEEGEVKDIFTNPKCSVTKQLLHLDANEIPEDLLKSRHSDKNLVRLGFKGTEAKQPIISQLIKNHAIDVNILSGGLDYVQHTTIGHLFIELIGDKKERDLALEFLTNHHVSYEVIA